MGITLNGRQAFVQALALPDYEPRLRDAMLLRAPAENDEKAGYICDGSLVSFVAGLSSQSKSDVLNSTLLAQLAANKKFDREKDTAGWYTYYHTVLENIGWVVQGFEFQKFNASGNSFTVDEVVVKVLEAIASGDELAVANQTLAALKSLSDGDSRLTLWNSATHSQSAGNFQIAACTEVDSNVAMKIGAFYFSTTESTSNFLWFRYSSSSTTIYKGGQTMTLNSEVYSRIRQDVLNKLGDRAKNFVADLDI